MSTSSVGGSGSIIDVQGVVSQLMKIEARPLNIAKQRVSTVDTSISAMSQVKSLVDAAASSAAALEDKLMLAGRSVANSDSGLLKVTVANSALASPGAYTVSDTKLAQSQRTAFAGFARSNVNFPSLGFGTLTIESRSLDYGALNPDPDDNNIPKSIKEQIDLEDKSLEAIRDEINARPLLSGKITASIVNTGDASLGYVLVLNGTKSGSTATFTASWNDSTFPNDNAIFYQGMLVSGQSTPITNPRDIDGKQIDQVAEGAQARVNGILLKSKTNVFSEAIAGLSFEILKTDLSTPSTKATTAIVTVRDNREILKERIRKFAGDITALNQRLVAMTKPGSQGEKAGPLAGNSGILSLSSSVFSTYVMGLEIKATNKNHSWSKLGLEWNRNGSVTVKESDLSNAIDGDIGTSMLGGFSSTIKDALSKFASGSLQASIDVLQTNRSRLSTNIDDLQSRLEKTRARLISKYASLDAKLVSMNQMGANLRSSLAGLQ